MKKKYITPYIQTIDINSKDIITTSDFSNPGFEPGEDDWED